MAYNRLGFCRYFDLTNVGQTDADKKRRARGEYTPKEMGVNLKQGYNGDLTSKQAGSVGGQMVKKMVEKYENEIKTK